MYIERERERERKREKERDTFELYNCEGTCFLASKL